MNNLIAVKEEMDLNLVLKEIDTMQAMCTSLMKTKHYQQMGEAGLFAIVQKAKSLNLNPLEALNGGLYFVQGKVGMSAELMNSMIRKAGHSIKKDSKSNETICILHGTRIDNGDTWTVSFSIDDAKRAGLLKNMYDKYPSIMLYNRAMSMLARQLFPDIIKGAGYTVEELKEIKSSEVEVSEVKDSFLIEDKISEEQIKELSDLLSKCDTNFIVKIWGTLKKTQGISCYEEIPYSLFDRLKQAALKNSTEYQNQLNEDALEKSEAIEV